MRISDWSSDVCSSDLSDLAAMARHCAAFDDAVAAADVSAMIQANWNLHQAIGAAAGNRHIERYYEQLLTDGLRIANLAMGHNFYGDARDRARNIQDGRELLERELKRLGLQQADPAPALQKFNAATLEDLQVMVALGDVGPHQVARALLEHERAANAPAATEGQELAVRAPRRKAKAPTSAFTVVGVGNLLEIGRAHV